MRARPAAAAVLVAALAAAVYGGVGSYDFVAFDDDRYVFQNPAVLSGLGARSLRWAFSTAEMGSWHPLTWISYLTTVSLFGTGPGPQHLVNAGLHLLGGLLLLRLLWTLTGALLPAALAAALWVVHPLHVESVAWIAERKDVLSGALLLATLLAWVRHLRAGSPRWYGVSLALFALSLMAKPIVVTLPLLLLLLDLWPLGRIGPGAPGVGRGRRVIVEKIPFVALALLAAALGYLTQKGAGALNPALLGHAGRRATNALLAAAGYLADTVWPSGLIPFYPLPAAAPAPATVAAAALLLLGCTAVALAAFRRVPSLSVGWAWFLATLVPVSGLVQAGGQARADRYTYLPLIGVFVGLSWAAAAVRWRGIARQAAVAAVAAALLGLAVAGRLQAAHWRDTRSLFGHALRVDPDNWMAHLILGNEDLAHGDVTAAGEHYRQALRAEPALAQAHERLGTIELDYRHDPAEALAHYRQALRLEPRSAVLHHNAGLALVDLGDLVQAEAAFRRAVSLNPRYALAYRNLGVVLQRAGRLAEAAAAYREALRLRPGDPQAARDLAAATRGAPDGRP